MLYLLTQKYAKELLKESLTKALEIGTRPGTVYAQVIAEFIKTEEFT